MLQNRARQNAILMSPSEIHEFLTLQKKNPNSGFSHRLGMYLKICNILEIPRETVYLWC